MCKLDLAMWYDGYCGGSKPFLCGFCLLVFTVLLGIVVSVTIASLMTKRSVLVPSRFPHAFCHTLDVEIEYKVFHFSHALKKSINWRTPLLKIVSHRCHGGFPNYSPSYRQPALYTCPHLLMDFWTLLQRVYNHLDFIFYPSHDLCFQ